MLNELFGVEVGDDNRMGNEINSGVGIKYISCNTNPHASPGKIIYRASMKDEKIKDDKIKIVLYTCKQWEDTLKGLFTKREDWTWEKVDGLGNENAFGVVKLVNSVEEAKEALQYLYKTFDERLREEAPQGAKRTTVRTKATKPAKTRKRPAKLM